MPSECEASGWGESASPHPARVLRRSPTSPSRGGGEYVAGARCYFCPGSLRLPVEYSLSSHSVHLLSCTTYRVISGTVFWP